MKKKVSWAWDFVVEVIPIKSSHFRSMLNRSSLTEGKFHGNSYEKTKHFLLHKELLLFEHNKPCLLRSSAKYPFAIRICFVFHNLLYTNNESYDANYMRESKRLELEAINCCVIDTSADQNRKSRCWFFLYRISEYSGLFWNMVETQCVWLAQLMKSVS